MILTAQHSRAICYGFLAGLCIHSLYPDQQWITPSLTLIASFLLVGLILFKKTTACVLCIFFFLGLIRFEFSPIPSGLKPLEPSGLTIIQQEVRTANRLDPRYWLLRYRTWLSLRSDQLFTREESALVKGVIWGEKIQNFKLKSQMRDSGLSHLTAISGANISWMLSLLCPILIKLGLNKRGAFYIGSACILLFIIFVGLGASVIRAAIMTWLMWLAKMVGRPAQSKHILLVTLTIYGWIEPTGPLFNPSLALSFLALIGLSMIGKNEQDRTLSSWKKAIKEATLTSCAAALMTTPYILWAFGRTNAFGIVANIIVAPIIPWLMIFGAATLFLAFPPWIAYPAKGLAQFVIFISEQTASLGSANVTISWQEMLLLYAAIWISYQAFSTSSVEQVRQKIAKHERRQAKYKPMKFDKSIKLTTSVQTVR